MRPLPESARARLSRLKRPRVDAGYRGRGRRWAEEVPGLSVEVVRKPKKPVPEKIAKMWAQEWAKEGKEVNWQGLMPPRAVFVGSSACNEHGWCRDAALYVRRLSIE